MPLPNELMEQTRIETIFQSFVHEREKRERKREREREVEECAQEEQYIYFEHPPPPPSLTNKTVHSFSLCHHPELK